MKFYKAQRNPWRAEIKEVEVERATDKSVWIRGQRNARFNSGENYFPTWEEAKIFLLAGANRNQARHRASVLRSEKLLGEIRALTEVTE